MELVGAVEDATAKTPQQRHPMNAIPILELLITRI
jgi:hypothetical protein